MIPPERRIFHQLEMWDFNGLLRIQKWNPSRNPRKTPSSSYRILRSPWHTKIPRRWSNIRNPINTPHGSSLRGVRLWLCFSPAINPRSRENPRVCSGTPQFILGLEIGVLSFSVVLRGIWNWIERCSRRGEMSCTRFGFEVILVSFVSCGLRNEESVGRVVFRHWRASNLSRRSSVLLRDGVTLTHST